MSDLTALFATSFLGMAGLFLLYNIYNWANHLAERLVASTVADRPMPSWFQARMLFQMWLPYQAGAFSIEVVFLIVFLEVADAMANESMKIVPYLFAFLCATGAAMALLTMTVGLSQYRKKLLLTQRES